MGAACDVVLEERLYVSNESAEKSLCTDVGQVCPYGTAFARIVKEAAQRNLPTSCKGILKVSCTFILSNLAWPLVCSD